MARCCRMLVTLCALAALPTAFGISIAPSNDTIIAAANGSMLTIQFSKTSMLGSPLQILPLTADSRDIPASMSGTVLTADISGNSILTTPQNSANLTSTDLAFISCDSADYNGFLTPVNVFNTAQEKHVAAAIFYSVTSNWCSLQLDNTTSSIRVYSSKSRSDAQTIVGYIQNSQHTDPTHAVISRAADGSPNNGTSAGDSNNGPLGPSPSTAVAMIVLYAITGVITLLFGLIIVSGAIRAHRHPERYGPLNGRIRRTRAGGIARAVLDSIPVVKFGDRQPPKPTDVELAPTTVAVPDETAPAASTSATEKNPVNEVREASGAGATAAMAGGIAAADTMGTTQSEEHGCSICTEDFEVGQDLRVLPCEHRFHSLCVDPWLLNVSGTCPLCRINLHPPVEEPATRATDVPSLDGSVPNNDRRRRSVLVAITGPRRPDGMSMEERIAALRNYRSRTRAPTTSTPGNVAGVQNSTSTSSEIPPTEEHGENRLRQQLSRVLNVRSWRPSQRGEASI